MVGWHHQLNEHEFEQAPGDGEGQGTVLQLPELAQTHVHRVSDAIQPYHPLSSPSPPAFNLSQH